MNVRQWFVCLALCSVALGSRGATVEQVSYAALGDVPSRSWDSSIEYGSDPLQRIYHWQAARIANASVVFIHGGCWLNAYDISHSTGFLTALAARGFSVYGIEYRRAGDPGGGWPGTYDDISTALDTLRPQLNPAKPVYVLGHSAGGHLALLAAPQLDFADKIIGLAAITDLRRYAKGGNSCQAATPIFMQRSPEAAPQAWAEADPRNKTMPASVLLLQGTQDAIVPSAQAEWPAVEHEFIEGAGHFDWLHPQSAAFAALLNVLKVKNDRH